MIPDHFSEAFLRAIPIETKEAYRQFFFKSDVAQSRIVILILAVATAIFGVSDYLILGLSFEFYILEVLRLGVVVYSALLIHWMRRVKDYRTYDRALFVYLLAFIAFSLLVNTTRISDFVVHAIIAGISVFAFYLAIPTRFASQAILSSLYTAAEVALMLLSMQPAAFPQLTAVLFSLVFANLIAALGSLQIHRFRFRLFREYNERKKTERFVTIGQTAGMVGHDIRNPLQAITSDLYLIQEELNQNPDCRSEDIADSINSINENIGYINKIVSDLQDYTRTLTLSPIDVNLKDLFLGVTGNVPSNIETQLRAEENLTIKTDAMYLRRVLTNLVINAIQAMPQGGKLTIEAAAKGDRVLIYVIDTGVGIPEEAKPNLFKPLFTTKAKGQGLGLAVVKRLVEALNGEITFESEEGKGTKFTVNLPQNG